MFVIITWLKPAGKNQAREIQKKTTGQVVPVNVFKCSRPGFYRNETWSF
jgi:hypothetical protein